MTVSAMEQNNKKDIRLQFLFPLFMNVPPSSDLSSPLGGSSTSSLQCTSLQPESALVKGPAIHGFCNKFLPVFPLMRRGSNCLEEFPVTQAGTSLVRRQNYSGLLLHRIPLEFLRSPHVTCSQSYALSCFCLTWFLTLCSHTLSLSVSLSLFPSISVALCPVSNYPTVGSLEHGQVALWLPLSLSFLSLHESLTLNTGVTDWLKEIGENMEPFTHPFHSFCQVFMPLSRLSPCLITTPPHMLNNLTQLPASNHISCLMVDTPSAPLMTNPKRLLRH